MKQKLIIKVILILSLLAYFASNAYCYPKIIRKFCNRTDRGRTVDSGGVGKLDFNDLHLTFTNGMLEPTPKTLGPPLNWGVSQGATRKVWKYSGASLLKAGNSTPTITMEAQSNKARQIKKHEWTINDTVKACCITFKYTNNHPKAKAATDFHAIFKDEIISACLVDDSYGGDANLKIKDFNSKKYRKVEISSFTTSVPKGQSIYLQVCYKGTKPPELRNGKFTYAGGKARKSAPKLVYNPLNRPSDCVTFVSTLPIDGIDPYPPLPFTTVSGLGTTTLTFADPEVPLEPGDGVEEDIWVNFYTDDTTDADFYILSTTWRGESFIPTLTEWGMIIFCVLLFGWMAYMVVRRRKKVIIGV